MDFGKTNEALNAKLVHDFDLNISYVEEFDLNAENKLEEFDEKAENKLEEQLDVNAENKLEEQLDVNAENKNAENKISSPILMNTQPASQNCIQNMNIEDAIANNADTTIQANSAAKGVSSVSFAPARISQYPRRRRRHRSIEAKPSVDQDRLCTNSYCKTRRTPLWRKGPLGPKTLCNACGIQYLKMVKGTGSGLPAAVSDDGGDASPGPVPAAEIVEEGDSNL